MVKPLVWVGLSGTPGEWVAPEYGTVSQTAPSCPVPGSEEVCIQKWLPSPSAVRVLGWGVEVRGWGGGKEVL